MSASEHDECPPGRLHVAMRLLLAGETERPLRPILVVTVLSAMAFSALWSYIGVWAVTALKATSDQIGGMFLVYAVAAALAGYAGGALSDRLGRRPVMVVGWVAESALVLILPTIDGHAYLGMALAIIAVTLGSPAMAASTAIVTDVIPAHRQERAYALIRVAFNLGNAIGPALAGLLLLSEGWPALFIAVTSLGLVSAIVAFASLPVSHGPSTGASSRSAASMVFRNYAFLLLLASTAMSYFLYVSYATALPITAVADYNLSPATWGFVAAINPIIVILLQVRVTEAAKGISNGVKLATATALMGVPFLLLLALPNIIGVVAVALVVVVGEMLWAPTAQALAARMAPPGLSGAYIGAFRGAGQVAWGLAPFAVLQIRGFGDHFAWSFVAAVALSGAFVGLAASRAARLHFPIRD